MPPRWMGNVQRASGAMLIALSSPYENEMRPQLDSRPRLQPTRTNSGTEWP
uniref:Uncharacterized protein n=1 Tax=Utricularia reniformis TaxID=192314 RepID=A0A1Y0B1J9_9LAMI|nr:hypothetical protein AEK19_MT1032 [Utricularia reniformis]ART31254.1 hypothetical protein AEK19_MT1032 [Utricularia reniformis]